MTALSTRLAPAGVAFPYSHQLPARLPAGVHQVETLGTPGVPDTSAAADAYVRLGFPLPGARLRLGVKRLRGATPLLTFEGNTHVG